MVEVWSKRGPLAVQAEETTHHGIAGKLNFSKKCIFSSKVFEILNCNFLPDCLTHKFGVTLSHFSTVGENVCNFHKVRQSARKCEEVCVNLALPEVCVTLAFPRESVTFPQENVIEIYRANGPGIVRPNATARPCCAGIVLIIGGGGGGGWG